MPNIEKYIIHAAVFENDLVALSRLLKDASIQEINKVDIHGRTPLMLATVLGHVECGELLLKNGANANTQNRRMWCLSHESVSLGDPLYLKHILNYRDYQRACQTLKILLDLRESLKVLADFYVEMSWEFTSWLRFVKNMCPSDTYKIYKSGSKIRIDTTLMDFDSSYRCKRGNQSFIFRFTEDDKAEIVFVNYPENVAYVQIIDLKANLRLEDFEPCDDLVAEKLISPITTSYVDVDNVGFERSKSTGLLSWIGSSDKEEEIEGYTCRVFNASNVEIITKTRMDHLKEEDKRIYLESENKTMSFLMGFFEKKKSVSLGSSVENRIGSVKSNDFRGGLTAKDYLFNEFTADKIGKPTCEAVRCNSFNASLYLADTFPLNLQEQIFPIIDLMSVRNAKFSRLKSFIQLQLPSGFPVRISIPLFHMINAQITFKHVNEPATGERYVDTNLCDDLDLPVFQLEPSLFEVPAGFSVHRSSVSLLFDNLGHSIGETDLPGSATTTAANGYPRYNHVDVDDDYVYLLERFMNEEGEFDLSQNSSFMDYRRQMQLAIERSLATDSNQLNEISLRNEVVDVPNFQVVSDAELAEALRLSQAEEEQRRSETQKEEEDLARAIELSKLFS